MELSKRDMVFKCVIAVTDGLRGTATSVIEKERLRSWYFLFRINSGLSLLVERPATLRSAAVLNLLNGRRGVYTLIPRGKPANCSSRISDGR